MSPWLIDKSALVRLAVSPDAAQWALRIDRGLVRISTVTRLEVETLPSRAQLLRNRRFFVALVLGRRDVADADAAVLRTTPGASSDRLSPLPLMMDTVLSGLYGHLDLAEATAKAMVRLMRSLARPAFIRLAPQSGLHLPTGGIYLGAVDRLLALLHDRLGNPLRADALFAAAVAQHEALHSPPWVARTNLDWAESLLARGERAEVPGHLDAASAGIGSLDLPANQLRLAELTARFSA